MGLMLTVILRLESDDEKVEYGNVECGDNEGQDRNLYKYGDKPPV